LVAVSIGAATVGVACPFCQSMFRDALPAVSEKPPKLMDIAQIVAAAMRIGLGPRRAADRCGPDHPQHLAAIEQCPPRSG